MLFLTMMMSAQTKTIGFIPNFLSIYLWISFLNRCIYMWFDLSHGDQVNFDNQKTDPRGLSEKK